MSEADKTLVTLLVHFGNFSGEARRLVRDVREGKRKAVLISEKNRLGTIGFQSLTGRMSKTQITLPFGDYRKTIAQGT